MKRLPLEGYRILDMTEVLAGPFGCSQLGDLGAEVIRIESYPRVAQGRPAEAQQRPGAGGLNVIGAANAPRPWDRSTAYHMVNRNKLGITLNVADPRGKDLFLRLVSKADALVVGYSAGTLSRMGFDYEILREHKADLVMLSMPAWGERGPYQGYAAYGSGPDALNGHHYLRGYPDLDPSATTACIHADALGAIGMPFAVMAALHYRDRTGKGQFIDFSMSEMLLNHLARPYMDWVMNNRIAEPVGNADPDIAPNGCYPCADADSWVVIVVRTDGQWCGLKEALGSPSWADDPRFEAVSGRIRHRDEIDARLCEWTRTLTPYDAFVRLQAVRVPAGPVYHVDGPPSDPHLKERGFYRWVTHPVTGQYRRPGPLFQLRNTPAQFRRHTNLLGEHNHEVLCGLLGLDEAQYEALIEAQLIGESYDPVYTMDAEDRAQLDA